MVRRTLGGYRNRRRGWAWNSHITVGYAAADMMERLQKLLAGAGHGSARNRRVDSCWSRDYQRSGCGARRSRRKHGPDLSRWETARPRRRRDAVEVLLYHKPVGEMTTRNDPEGRPTVFERLPPPASGRWIVVGRLDVNTSGLLLFTNDGELAHRLMHPSNEIRREYLVRLRGSPSDEVLERLRRGVELRMGRPISTPSRCESTEGSHTWIRVSLHEGRNREVRRLFEHEGFVVSRLTRIRYGNVELPRDLAPVRSMNLATAQISELARLAGAE